MVKVFLSYGDRNFIKSRKRIIKEAKQLKFFDRCILETENIKNDTEFKYELDNNINFRNVYSNKKGGGYWIWKSYIIYKNLKLLNDNDILVYTDAGSVIPNNKLTKDKLKKYIKKLKMKNKGAIGFRQKFIESEWTKGDIFKFFNVLDNKKIYNSGQFMGGLCHIIRKCKHSILIYDKWWKIAKNHPHLFDDSPSKIKNFNNFKQNRHDQSVWSLLCKTMNICEVSKKNIPFLAKRIRK